MDRNSSLSGAVTKNTGVATHEGGVDRNVSSLQFVQNRFVSPPTRVAWIETPASPGPSMCCRVATHEGGVDRNMIENPPTFNISSVATHEGGVDRNDKWEAAYVSNDTVATHEGGVDRNTAMTTTTPTTPRSPPTRVAWIETQSKGVGYRPPRRRHPRGWRG